MAKEIQLISLLLLFYSQTATAIKPCNAPCTDGLNKCFVESHWVADGTISNVYRKAGQYPQNKDFTTFTFTIDKMVKGIGYRGDIINLEVGWCENYYEIPEDYNGTWRFYGLGDLHDLRAKYLFFHKTGSY